MDPQLLRSIWPVFSAETREQIQAIGSKVLGLEGPAQGREPDLLPSLKRLVHSLKGSAASLGLDDIEQVVHAIEDGLATFNQEERLPRDTVEAMLRGLSAIEGAMARGDAGQSPVVEGLSSLLAALGHESAEAVPQTAASGAAAQGLEVLDLLEAGLSALCSPDVPDRAAVVRTAVERARTLKTSAESAGAQKVATLAEAAALGFTRMEPGGDSAGLAASDVAGTLVDLRTALEAEGAQGRWPAPSIRCAPRRLPRPWKARRRRGPRELRPRRSPADRRTRRCACR
ncbi:Hpt domain-containing protein [Myxococcus sp. MxC21-1]|uniref:Hpt domain-containing protein n=1 Tax=Myxococcus sp. MxC21-1 TaxID=3041439 RepID=UPI00292D1DCB|nr:Hpt domain-containing protein [Myxococcus sp. MxC21-1]WNZ64723.1 Hpt domain-containing protein [Myxococcus sp. MxC21-1]